MSLHGETMLNSDFWQRCVDSGCVIIPVRTYRDVEGFNDDGYSNTQCLGVKFLAFPISEPFTIGSAYWQIDTAVSNATVFDTPEKALEDWISGSEDSVAMQRFLMHLRITCRAKAERL